MLGAAMLQWGRARASAEIVSEIVSKTERTIASMGPRSCERGNSLNLGRAAFQSRASMGPRSCERGNVLILPGSVPVPCGFNGAALVRARKWDGKGARVSFVAWLQWGRARASAEIPPGRGGLGALHDASMGPRSCERGNQQDDNFAVEDFEASMGPRSCERGNRV